jgi:hypothetical protein
VTEPIAPEEPTAPEEAPAQEPVTGTTIPLVAEAEPEPEEAEPEPEVETSLTTKIATIEGEHFSVPYDMPVDQIRENLAGTYPGIRTANVAKGTIAIGGVRYETVEFSKQAGTKGQQGEGNPLLALADLPRVRLGPIPDQRNARLLQRGAFTFAEALDLPLFEGQRPSLPTSGGLTLCQRFEDLSAAAAGPGLSVPGWSA